jgi:hypothetical protein
LQRRTAEAFTRITQFVQRNRRSDGRSDKLRKEEERRRVNAIKSHQNAGYDDAYEQPPPPRPQGQRSQNAPPRTKPDTQRIDRKPLAPKDERNLPRPETTRMNERDQDLGGGQLIYQRPSPSTPEKSYLQDEDGSTRSRDDPLVKVPSEPDHPSVLPPRVTDVGEISGQEQGPESQGIETRGSGEVGSDSSAVVDKIYRRLRKARIEFPSKHFEKDISNPCSLGDIDMALCDLIKAYGSLYQSAHESNKALKAQTAEYESLQTRFNNEKDKWAKKTKVLEKENENEKIRTSVLREEHASREQRHESKITKIQKEHHAIEDVYKLQIQRLESEMEQLKKGHKDQINSLGQRHREQEAAHDIASKEEFARAKRDYDLRLEKISKQYEDDRRQMTGRFEVEKTKLSSTAKSQREQYEARLANLRKENEDDKRRMTSEHQIKKREMEKKFHEDKAVMEGVLQSTKDQFHTQLSNIRDEHNQEMDRKATEIEMIRMEYEANKKKMDELHHAKIVELETKWKQENKELRVYVEDLTEALLKRDHFKAMSDHDLAIRFQDLANEVDQFARARWDHSREPTWPFPDRVLRKSENERRTKQYIVQNTLWVILFERIFCTPFRVLGDEGKSLERRWIEEHGQGEPLYSILPNQMTKLRKTVYLLEHSLFVQGLPKTLKNGGTKI